jgi:threonine dehydrogenase-like Zn-dependent dehydrogenase
VPAGVTDEEAVWAEPLAAALAVFEVGLAPGDRVLVVGDGRLAALIGLALQARGLFVEIRGKHPSKLSRLQSLGLSTVTGEPRAIYPWVVEATGSAEGVEAARAWARPRGTIILKSTCHEPARIETSRIVVDELRLVGSRCGDFEPALEVLAKKSMPLNELVSAIHPFREIERAFRESARPETFKILLDFRAKS